jgi:uncharacterized membrane protein
MSVRTYQNWALALSAAGVAFSGYLGGTRLFTNSCAFSEPCPTFLGQPACYFGFALFFSLFVVSIAARVSGTTRGWPVVANLVLSLAGTLFAGYFAVAEIHGWFARGFTTYSMGVSTCVYGALFFAALLGLSVAAGIRPTLRQWRHAEAR